MNPTVIRGRWFDGRCTRGTDATLHAGADDFSLRTADLFRRYRRAEVEVSPWAGARSIHRLDFADGGCLEFDAGQVFPGIVAATDRVGRLEAHWGAVLVALVLIAACIAFGVRAGIPFLAEGAVARIPPASETATGRRALDLLDRAGHFETSQIGEEDQARLRRAFTALTADVPGRERLRLEFRSWAGGPNAFALPGGILVVTDDMVAATETEARLMAVLAHEVGHVEHRHAMRQLIVASAGAAMAAALTGDAGAAASTATVLPSVMLRTAHSREFEAEADRYAIALLKRNRMPPELLAEALESSGAAEDGRSQAAFLSTHPPTGERIRWARDAAGRNR